MAGPKPRKSINQRIKNTAKKVGKVAAMGVIAGSMAFTAHNVGSEYSKFVTRNIINDKITSEKFMEKFNENKAKPDSVLIDRVKLNEIINKRNQQAKKNEIVFWDGKKLDKITLPKYAMTLSNTFNLLPKESKIKIEAIIKKAIMEINTSNIETSSKMLDYKDIIENANYNKLERVFGKKTNIEIQTIIKQEISKLPKEKQKILLDKLNSFNGKMIFYGAGATVSGLFFTLMFFEMFKKKE